MGMGPTSHSNSICVCPLYTLIIWVAQFEKRWWISSTKWPYKINKFERARVMRILNVSGLCYYTLVTEIFGFPIEAASDEFGLNIYAPDALKSKYIVML